MKRPALTLFETEALAILARIEARAIPLVSDGEWGVCGVYHFHAEGWTFAVFNDAGEWDYLEWVQAPDGRMWDFSDGWDVKTEDESPALMDWTPNDDAIWTEAKRA